MPTKTPVDPFQTAYASGNVSYQLKMTDPSGWFGPGQPVAPQAQDAPGVAGRRFDFAVGHNLRRSPRDGESGVTFAEMRALADGYDLLRLVIETRKDQMCKMEWGFGVKVRAGKKVVQGDARCDQLNDFFAYPDKEHPWETWLRALLEDLLVLDAPTLYPRRTLGGDLYGFELVDGATIKRVIDATGRTPLPPEVAYQQILKGVPAADYHRDELVYAPRNVRTHKVYGYSPVEQVIMTVNIAMRRQLHQLQSYTEGNIPDAMIGVPPDWNPDHIKQFQEYWDSILEGNTAARRHAKFVPGGLNVHFTKEALLKDAYDEWLARIICFAFSISPQALVAQMNRATAETAHAQALQEGLQPVMLWVKNLMDMLVWKYFGWSDIEFRWREEEELSPLAQMQVLTGYLKEKVLTDDEVRESIGRDPFTPEQREALAASVPPPLMGFAGQPHGATAPTAGDQPPDDPPPDPQKPPAAPQKEDPDMGKAQRPALRKGALAPLSRDRAASKTSVGRIAASVTAALAGAVAAAAESIQAELGKASDTERIAALVASIPLDDLIAAQPDLEEYLRAMYADGGAVALAQVLLETSDDMLALVNQNAVEYAKQRAATLVTSIAESTRDMLRSTVARALEEGWSNDTLAAELSSAYPFSAERAMLIARTETAWADVQGNLTGYKASGVVAKKRWIIAQDEFCDDCRELDGVEVDLDSEFPGGHDGPPLHPNCRCDVVPVVED
jgi:SPP1 gp7 family putative phage head morphogenesis protein